MRERGLKYLPRPNDTQPGPVAPVRERGLKCRNFGRAHGLEGRRSREGAWIEIAPQTFPLHRPHGRSREGAWIEIISSSSASICWRKVAPVRERGLKLKHKGGIFPLTLSLP